MKKFRLNTLTALFVMAAMSVFTSCGEDDPVTKEIIKDEVYSKGKTTFTVSGSTVTIKDVLGGDGVGNYTMYADTTYILDGFVFVNEGQALTVQAGTMIQGLPGQKESASALIVARGAKIMANGTAEKPIVFTAFRDTYSGIGRYDLKVNALWGGLIVLGKAQTNNTADKRIEGLPSTEPRAYYGGDENTDNSGSLMYVCVRHGGTNIGDANEINGISLGAVGSGTVIDYIEVVANKDDGIEFFGGVAQVKHALVSFIGDDCFDYDEGFSGKGQYWVGLQGTSGERCAEQDGGVDGDETAEPYSNPTIYNATYLGIKGIDGVTENPLMVFRDNAAGTYANSIFANTITGINVEYRSDKHNSYDQLKEGRLVIKNNIFQDVADGEVASFIYVGLDDKGKNGPVPAEAPVEAAKLFNDNMNKTEAVGLVNSNTVASIVLVPTSGADSGVAATDDFFDKVTFQGAFEPNGTNWAKGWTLSQK